MQIGCNFSKKQTDKSSICQPGNKMAIAYPLRLFIYPEKNMSSQTLISRKHLLSWVSDGREEKKSLNSEFKREAEASSISR